MTQENKQKIYKTFQSSYKWVDGKRKLNEEIPDGLTEVEIDMEHVTDTTDDEFLNFREGKILLTTSSEMMDAYCLRLYKILKKRYDEANKIS